jgi:hypothetical protein
MGWCNFFERNWNNADSKYEDAGKSKVWLFRENLLDGRLLVSGQFLGIIHVGAVTLREGRQSTAPYYQTENEPV